jgi:hypothetical protein
MDLQQRVDVADAFVLSLLQDCSDSHPYGLFTYLLEELNKLNLA